MPVQSSEGQMRNNIAYCLLFVLLIVGPGAKSLLIAVGLAGSCQWSPATRALRQMRLRDSTWNTRKSCLACRQSWLIGRATGEINQSKSNFKNPVLSVPCCAGESHLWCPRFSSPILNSIRNTFPVQLMKLPATCSSLSPFLRTFCHNPGGSHQLIMAVEIPVSNQSIRN